MNQQQQDAAIQQLRNDAQRAVEALTKPMTVPQLFRQIRQGHKASCGCPLCRPSGDTVKPCPACERPVKGGNAVACELALKAELKAIEVQA